MAEKNKNLVGKAVRNGTMGINMTARIFPVPSSTLKDRTSGRVKHAWDEIRPCFILR